MSQRHLSCTRRHRAESPFASKNRPAPSAGRNIPAPSAGPGIPGPFARWGMPALVGVGQL